MKAIHAMILFNKKLHNSRVNCYHLENQNQFWILDFDDSSSRNIVVNVWMTINVLSKKYRGLFYQNESQLDFCNEILNIIIYAINYKADYTNKIYLIICSIVESRI